MDIVGLIASYGAWSWVVAGLVLLALELVVPGGVFIWLGGAGIVTGLIAWLVPLDYPWQFLIYGVLALASIAIWLRYIRGRERPSDSPMLNRRMERFIGHEAVLEEPIRDGFGRVSLGDTVWRISGPDLPVGQKVRIVAADGAVLKVEAA